MKALKQLQELDFQDKQSKYPTVPRGAIPAGNFTDKTANGLTKAILRFFEIKGIKAWRQSSEGRYRPGQKVTDVLGHVRQMNGIWLPGQNNGQSDIAAIIRGQFVAIEVKMNDTQSEAQTRYQTEIENSGGVYIIVRSFDEFMQWYNTITIIQ